MSNLAGGSLLAAAKCPSWVNRAILTMRRPLPIFPRKRTSSGPLGMSQKCQKATSFDHLIGELLQLRGHVKAESPRGLDVDDQAKLGRLFDR